ncbi:deacetoxyvindoline 4-hydroxylase [Capsicum chacoense]
MSSTKESRTELPTDYDRLEELKTFDHTKTGVKALVDEGILEIPRIFIRPPDELAEELNRGESTLQVPVVDISGIEVEDRRKEVVDEIREASEKWGFFQLINHGVPSSVLEGMIDGTRKFHEQDAELKKDYYSRDRKNRRVRYETDLHLYNSKTVNWRDTFNISMIVTGHIEPEEIPEVCRKEFLKFMNHIRKLGETLLDLLSEALGLKPDHLKAMECIKGQTLVCHYYPACPQPELTLGTDKHTDPDFLTILVQDQSGGLQVVHNNQWVNVEPIEPGLVVNVGDFLQILSNDKFLSVNHRVVANKIGPRISTACFFTGVFEPPKMYGPIKELISEEKPPLNKEFLVSDYITQFFSRPLDKSGLDLFRL